MTSAPSISSDIWRVCLLGSPSVARQEQKLSPRSQESWGVLTSLLLPPRLDLNAFSDTNYLRACSRALLAERFWGDKMEPRLHLRQALSYLKTIFGKECFLVERDTVSVAPGRFTTDLEQILIYYRRAQCAESLEEKIYWLTLAETRMCGELLAGYDPPLTADTLWVQNRRQEVRGILTTVLLSLVQQLHDNEQDHAALSIAVRVLEIDPHCTGAQKWVWTLSQKTGQSFVPSILGSEDDLATATAQLETTITRKGRTLSDQRHFQELFERELSTSVREEWHPRYLALSVFPAPFTPELARQVCSAPRTLLRALIRTPLLRQVQDTYVVPEPVRVAARRKISPDRRQRLERRLAMICERWVISTCERSEHNENKSLFLDLDKDLPAFFRLALRWSRTQPPTVDRLNFIGYLHRFGMADDVFEALPYLENACEQASHSFDVRWHAGAQAGVAHQKKGDFVRAAHWYERTIDLSSPLPQTRSVTHRDATIRSHLSFAYHYAGDSKRALVQLGYVNEYFQKTGDVLEQAHILRQTCEIQCNVGLLEEALVTASEAVSLRRAAPAMNAAIADALFWQGSTLARLKRTKEAFRCIEEALSLWQEVQDLTGIGHCLRVYGQLCAAEGRFTEARAHIEHAILLHEKTGSQGCLAAARQALSELNANA